MTSVEILNLWMKYTNYNPEKKTFTINAHSEWNSWDIHKFNEFLLEFSEKIDKNFIFTLCCLRSVFNQINESREVTIKSVLDNNIDNFEDTKILYKELNSEDSQVYDKKIISLVENVCSGTLYKKIGNIPIDSINKLIYPLAKELLTCKKDVYESSENTIGVISTYIPKIYIFKTMGDCILTIKNYPDGIYICSIVPAMSQDSYFSFMVKSNGNLFSISDRLQEAYIGQHGNCRNARYTDDKSYKLFPYSIFDYSEHDYLGYATKIDVKDSVIDFDQLESEEEISLALAMIFISEQFSNTVLEKKSISLTTSLFPKNILPETKALVTASNNSIMNYYSDFKIDLTQQDIFKSLHSERSSDIDILIKTWASGFEFDTDFTSLLDVKNNNEFIADKEFMSKLAWKAERQKLAEYIRAKIKEAFIKDRYGNKTCEWYENLVRSNKDLVLSAIKKGEYQLTTRLSDCHVLLNEIMYDPYYCAKDLFYKTKCSIFCRIGFKTYKDIEKFFNLKDSDLPDLMLGWNYDGHRTINNSILDFYDPMEEVGTVFEELRYGHGFDSEIYRLAKSIYSDYFSIMVAFSKRGFDKLMKGN